MDIGPPPGRFIRYVHRWLDGYSSIPNAGDWIIPKLDDSSTWQPSDWNYKFFKTTHSEMLTETVMDGKRKTLTGSIFDVESLLVDSQIGADVNVQLIGRRHDEPGHVVDSAGQIADQSVLRLMSVPDQHEVAGAVQLKVGKLFEEKQTING